MTTTTINNGQPAHTETQDETQTGVPAIVSQLEGVIAEKAEERRAVQAEKRQLERHFNEQLKELDGQLAAIDQDVEGVRNAVRALGGRPSLMGTSYTGRINNEREIIKEEAIKVLQRVGEPMQENHLRDEVAVGYEAMKNAIKELVAEGVVTRKQEWGSRAKGQGTGQRMMITLVDASKAKPKGSPGRPVSAESESIRDLLRNEFTNGRRLDVGEFAKEHDGLARESIRKAADALVGRKEFRKIDHPEKPGRVLYERIH